MFFTVGVGLYTSRVLLANLGFNDYGLYNVIGGIIAMFGFINNAMTNVTSRYITYYLGEHNYIKLNNIFCTAILIHVFIAIIIFLIGETVGLWYLENKMVIPELRLDAARIIYQLSILSSVLMIVSVPFTSEIIAHEKMSVYAGLSLLDALLKLIIVYVISVIEFDKLIIYGSLLFAVQVTNFFVYFAYCRLNFKESKFYFHIEKKMLKEMFCFAGWSMAGNFAFLFYTHGINLLLNLFCGPVVNAARGIAVQIEGVMKQFAANVQTAINPQIIKSYSQNDLQRMHSLIISSCKFCFLLIFLISLPLILEIKYVLGIWLVNFPEHTVNFVRLTLIGILLDTLINPLFTANLATGKVKIYQVRLCSLSFGLMPVAYIVIKLTGIPESLFLITLGMHFVGIFIRLFILKKQIHLSITNYVKKVLFCLCKVILIAVPIPMIIHLNFDDGFNRFLFTSVVALIVSAFSIFYLGLTQEERNFVVKKGKNLFRRFADK